MVDLIVQGDCLGRSVKGQRGLRLAQRVLRELKLVDATILVHQRLDLRGNFTNWLCMVTRIL